MPARHVRGTEHLTGVSVPQRDRPATGSHPLPLATDPGDVTRHHHHAFRWTCARCGVDELTASTTRLVRLADACRSAGCPTTPQFLTLTGPGDGSSNV